MADAVITETAIAPAGSNGTGVVTAAVQAAQFGQIDERAAAEQLARRYRAEFADLKHFKIQHDLLRTVPVELMFRFNFVPLELKEDVLVIAVSDPSKLMVLDEIAGLLGHRIEPRVATLTQITDLLKKTEQSQRVLDEASEGMTFDVVSAEDNPDENISIESLAGNDDLSPIIRLVDTTIFTALERRASDVHIETYDDSLLVKYRIDGVLQPAMAPIAREHHQTILSRIKIMSELDIAERRVPQDGRFRVRYKGRGGGGGGGGGLLTSEFRLCRQFMAKTLCSACSTRSR